jgi:hypothetical protein
MTPPKVAIELVEMADAAAEGSRTVRAPMISRPPR